MREFSDYEKMIINTHLINGAGITGMLSSDLLERGKFHITIDPDKRQRFVFSSSEIPVENARDELVNLVELLIYLNDQRLLRMYPPVSTNIDDFNATVSFTLGDSWSEQSYTFLMHEKSNYIGEFLKYRRDYTFKATEPLKKLVERSFRTEEEIRHLQIITQASRANRLTLIIAVASVLIGFLGIIIQNYTERKQLAVDTELLSLDRDHLVIDSKNSVRDSAMFTLIQNDLQQLRNDLSSSKMANKKLQVKFDSLTKTLIKKHGKNLNSSLGH